MLLDPSTLRPDQRQVLFHEKRTSWILCSIIFALILFSGPASGQREPLNPMKEQFPPSSYEAHPQVYCGSSGPEGGVWFGTQGKLLHNRGADWESFPLPSGMTIFAMDIDRNGRIWVGGQGGFGYFRPVGAKGTSSHTPGSLEYVPLEEELPDSLRDFNAVWNVHADEGRVFFNALNTLFHYDGERITEIRPQNSFFFLHRVSDELWIQDKGKGFYRIPEQLEFPEAPHPTLHLGEEQKIARSKKFSEMNVIDVLDTPEGLSRQKSMGKLLITKRNGAYRYHPKEGGKRSRSLEEKEWGAPFLSKATILHALPLDPKRNPWRACLALSTRTKGVLLLGRSGELLYSMDQKKGSLSDFVWKTFHGNPGSGDLWSATNKGIVRWTVGDPRTFAREGESIEGRVMDLSFHNGDLFIGTTQGIYVRKEKRDREWKFISGSRGQCTDLLSLDPKGEEKASLLLGALGNNGFFKIQSQEDELMASRIDADHCDQLTLPLGKAPKDKSVMAISGGRQGLHFFQLKKGHKIRKKLSIKAFPEEFSSLYAERNKNGGLDLWLGHPTVGAHHLRIAEDVLDQKGKGPSPRSMELDEILEGTIEKVSGSFIKAGEQGLPPKGEVHFEPFKNRIAVLTQKGLYKILKADPASSGKEDQKIRFAPDSILGPPLEGASKEDRREGRLLTRFKESDDGTVWSASKDKIYRAQRKGPDRYHIDSIPFQGSELDVIYSFLPGSEQVTWIGASKGILRYDAKVQKDHQREYPCLLQKVSSSLPKGKTEDRKRGDSVLFAGFYRSDSLLDRTAEQPPSYRPSLPYGMNNIRFRFSAPFFEKREHLQFSYRLEGFEERWSEWKKEGKKAYTNLWEGSYTFKVKARNIYGVESETAVYRFTVLPPWYRTWPAYGTYTLAAFGMLWLLVRLNTQRLRARQKELERIVAERTREIQEQQAATEAQKQEVEKKNKDLQNANETITRQKEEVEEAHREIQDSIDYAQKIQQALLLTEKKVADELPEHYIFFKPQATVSGDFYWAREKDGSFFFAVVDCTGHGVPGAFMSMLGISHLHEIVASRQDPSPGEVLTELRERVVGELSGPDPESAPKDGMDAALVKIPKPDERAKEAEKITLYFAGANNPLYIVRKGIATNPPEGRILEDEAKSLEERIRPFRDRSDGIELKGDKMPVGYFESEDPPSFETAELELQNGDMIHLFSDGYADQFGGDSGKKFRYGPFKELLANIRDRPVEEQKDMIEKRFEEWKGEEEQIDDVCVAGIRLR